MPILNQQRRDEIVRIATCGICQTEYELQFLKERSQRKILNYLATTNEEFSYGEPEILSKQFNDSINNGN